MREGATQGWEIVDDAASGRSYYTKDGVSTWERPACFPPFATNGGVWTAHTAPDGRVYFFNARRNVSTYDVPPEGVLQPSAASESAGMSGDDRDEAEAEAEAAIARSRALALAAAAAAAAAPAPAIMSLEARAADAIARHSKRRRMAAAAAASGGGGGAATTTAVAQSAYAQQVAQIEAGASEKPRGANRSVRA